MTPKRVFKNVQELSIIVKVCKTILLYNNNNIVKPKTVIRCVHEINFRVKVCKEMKTVLIHSKI